MPPQRITSPRTNRKRGFEIDGSIAHHWTSVAAVVVAASAAGVK
jgi:hypothetical protein